jgi:anti-sigma factor RsiW
MCPDPQILSIYLDGELPSPWKEKMQSHFAKCPICKEKLENMRKLQYLFKKDKSVKRTFVERVIDDSDSQTNTKQESLTNKDFEFTENENSAITKAKERVWKKLEAKQRYSFRKNLPHSGLWRRKLYIPLPAAAAAVLILLAGIFYFRMHDNNGITGQYADNFENSSFILAAEMEKIEDIPAIVPATDISELLQYLSPNMGTNIIILQLPESQNFFRAGDPAVIRAADFQRNTVPRR